MPYFEVIHTIGNQPHSLVVLAPDAAVAQETFIDECEARGETHGAINAIRRVWQVIDVLGTYYVPFIPGE